MADNRELTAHGSLYAIQDCIFFEIKFSRLIKPEGRKMKYRFDIYTTMLQPIFLEHLFLTFFFHIQGAADRVDWNGAFVTMTYAGRWGANPFRL